VSSKRLVLSVSLDTSEQEAEVCCLFKREEERLDEWRFTAKKMGLPDFLDRRTALNNGYEFDIPGEVLGAMKRWVEPHRPLWLRLERPAGYLRLVPWEQLLQPRLEVPVLRLPDIETDRPRESSKSLDVILCGSLPVAKNPFPIAKYLVRIAESIHSAVPRQTTLHVFTDSSVHQEVKQRFEAKENFGSAIRLYSPESAGPYVAPDPASRITDEAGRIESPWLLWIRDSLKGRSIDVAHFLCHGYFWNDQEGALAFAESPLENYDRRTARFVRSSELSIFMTQAGAWSAAFSSPEHNYSKMGLRLLADAMAQVRPGPVLHQDLRLDSGCDALGQAYAFLYGLPGAPPPASPALSLSCQPSWLEGPAIAQLSHKFSLAVKSSATLDLERVFETAENVPGWIAAAERSLEQADLRLQKMEKRNETGQTRRTELGPVEANLRRVQEIIARAATKLGDKP